MMAELSSGFVGARHPERAEMDLGPPREHRAFIVIFVLSAMLAALALTYIYSERYRSEVTILFKPTNVTELVKHSKEAFGTAAPGSMVTNITHTIDDLVHSDAVLRRIVTKFHFDVQPPLDLSGTGLALRLKEMKYALRDLSKNAVSIAMFGRVMQDDPTNQAVARLRKQIKLLNEDSYVYTLQATADTPERAAAVADEAAATLVALLRREEERSVGRPTAELVALRDSKVSEIEAIEAAIRDLLSKHVIASIKDEMEKTTDSISGLRRAREDALADFRQSEGKVAAYSAKLQVPGGTPSAAGGQPTALPRQFSRINADDYAKLTSNKLEAEVNTASLRARLDALDRSIATLNPRLQILNRVYAEYDVLSAKLSSAKRDYAALTDALQEMAIRTANSPDELRIAAGAATPIPPISPIKLYHVLFATALATLIACGLAYVLDYFGVRLFLPPVSGRRQRSRLLAMSDA
jgi:uncharacterized protein involved in exopolysaccharide biosynthesis